MRWYRIWRRLSCERVAVQPSLTRPRTLGCPWARALPPSSRGTLDSAGSKTPGAAVPLAVAIATKNPLGLIVSTGVKLHGEQTGSSTIQGKARETATEIAAQLKPRFQEQG